LSAVAFLDRVNISVAGSSLRAAYGLSTVELGWIFSSFLVGYALFQTLAGRLADRFGPRRVLASGVTWWGVFTALTASVPSRVGGALTLFIAIRFLLGAGEAVVYPASNQFIARWIPARERGIANGWIFAGVGAGASLSPPLITYLMLHYGWRASFGVCAILGVLAGAIWYGIARDDPAEHPRVSAGELALIRSGLSESPDHASLPRVERGRALVPWRTVVRNSTVLGVTLSYFCFGYVAWIFFSWFYIYLAQVRGMNLKASAWFATLPFLAMAIGCPLGGKISDRLTLAFGPKMGRCRWAAFGMMLAAVFLTLGSFVESAPMASGVLAGGAGALYLAQSSFWSVSADIAGGSAGSISGFMNMGAQIGGAVTASLTPWIAGHFGWTASFLTAALLCLIGAALWLGVNPAAIVIVDEAGFRSAVSAPPVSASGGQSGEPLRP
ncbi:MAG TPA: MFS transporter, partial [Terriglobales bacterium]|nr:MFS transporter [Terriglobales bacterium]